MNNTIYRFMSLSQFSVATLRLAAWIGLAGATTLLQPTSSSAASMTTIESNFESSGLEGWRTEELCCDHSAQIVSDPEPAYEGDYALRFKLRRNDPDIARSKRAEVKLRPVEPNSEYTYRFRTFLPQSFTSDREREIIAQWHSRPDFSLGEGRPGAPPLSLHTINGDWMVLRRWDSKQITQTNQPEGKQNLNLGEYVTNEWTDWVFQVKWSHTEDGMLKVWKDGKLVVEESGANTYNDLIGTYFKAGIYKPGWKHRPERSAVDERVVFFDDVNIIDSIDSISANPDLTADSAAVPEPLTLLGTGTALGLGAVFKRRYSRGKKP
ncbi:MAG: PEP-CTERM sorting domain-containing protein [Cyanophyceae cyanobacterium]